MGVPSNLSNQLLLTNAAVLQSLWVQFKSGSVWRPTMTQTDGVPTSQYPNGTPLSWPAGTTASIVFTDSAPDVPFSVTYSGVVSGANISFSLTVAQAAAIPDGCKVQLFIDQSGTGTAPDEFATGTANQVG